MKPDGAAAVVGSARGETAIERSWREDCLAGSSLLTAAYSGHSFARHRHETFVLGVDTSGLSSTWYRGAERPVPRGHLLVLAPWEVHTGSQRSADLWRCRMLYPGVDLIEQIWSDLTGRSGETPSFRSMTYPDADLVGRFLRAHRWLEAGDDPLTGESAMIGVLQDLLARHATGGVEPAKRRRGPARLAPALELLGDRLDAQLSLAELAAAAGYSRFHFLRLFARSFGMTPHAYRMQRRIDKARDLLRRGHAIAETAYACGFADQSHLTRRFKEFVGVSPGEFARGCD